MVAATSFRRALLIVLAATCCLVTAFSTTRAAPSFFSQARGTTSTALHIKGGGGDGNTNNEDNNDNTSSLSSSSPTPKAAGEVDPTAPLTGTLARLDRQWKIQQRAKPATRWTQLFLNDENDDSQQRQQQNEENMVYLLEPPNQSRPSCLIVFIGGAGLGQFPQVAYNELLLRISDRLNAAVIAAPYQIGLDHFALAKRVGELARKAIIQCEDDPERMYPTTLPTYCIGHSLGCKLATIYMAATDQQFEGMGFMSFNNFALSQTVSMAKEFADIIGRGAAEGVDSYPGGGIGGMSDSTRDILDQVFGFAETAISYIGIDFSPNPAETERLIEMKYDDDRQRKTRLFAFDDDNLENTQDFVRACPGAGPEVSGLPGTHLTPVYFKIGLDQIPEEARAMASDAMGGFQSASFGVEEELVFLVDEICGWILGKPPSRLPKWQQERPRIAASTTDEEQ